MLLSIKVELIPNNKQITAFKKASGVARHAYNWANAIFKDTLRLRSTQESLKLPSSIDLHKKLVAEVKSVNPWYYQTNKNVPQQAIKELRTAWDRFFKKLAQQPRFKKKGKHDSFYLESGSKAKPMIKSDGRRVKLPSIGWVRLTETLPVKATHNCVISRTADKWFIAIKYEIEKPVVETDRPSVGVDIGIKELAVCSNGKVFNNPKAYRRMSSRLKRLQRRLSKKKRGSNNRRKAVSRLAKLHARIANIRKDAIHKLTTYLAKNHSIIKIEDLNVEAFLKNHKLAGAIADCGMYEFKRQLEYKTLKFSSQLILVDRMFPSSQICSNCGNHRHKMPLSERIYVCPECGHIEDRDINASKNIERWFEGIFIPVRSELTHQTVSSTEIACGVDKPMSLRHRTKPVSSDSFNRQIEATLKQEVNTKTNYVHASRYNGGNPRNALA